MRLRHVEAFLRPLTWLAAIPVLSAALLMGSCSRLKPWQVREPALLAENEQTCSLDDECTIIEDLCGCSSMGVKYAVPKAYAEETRKRMIKLFADRACLDALSADPSCWAAEARCVDHRCVLFP